MVLLRSLTSHSHSHCWEHVPTPVLGVTLAGGWIQEYTTFQYFEKEHFFHFWWCQLLALSRNIVVVTYFNTFFFCFVWRMVFIRYSDRGLVLNGQPNTLLLKKLHWIIFTTFVSISIAHYPIQKIISGTFQETIAGKVCLLQTFTLENEVSRKTFIGAKRFPSWSTSRTSTTLIRFVPKHFSP